MISKSRLLGAQVILVMIAVAAAAAAQQYISSTTVRTRNKKQNITTNKPPIIRSQREVHDVHTNKNVIPIEYVHNMRHMVVWVVLQQ